MSDKAADGGAMILFSGAVFLSCGIGYIHGTAYGCITFGIICLVMFLIGVVVEWSK